MCGEEPYNKLDEDEVKRRFENFDFPTSDHLGCGTLIQNCWVGYSLLRSKLYKL